MPAAPIDHCFLVQVDEIITKMSRKGMTPSMIGVVLRDSHGVPQVGSVTGSKVLRILKKNGLAPEIPEDLYYMIKKAVVMRKHLEVNRKDKDGKFRLILVESRIHRLARYYKVRTHTQVHALFRLAGLAASPPSLRAACPVRPRFSLCLSMSFLPLGAQSYQVCSLQPCRPRFPTCVEVQACLNVLGIVSCLSVPGRCPEHQFGVRVGKVYASDPVWWWMGLLHCFGGLQSA